MGDRPFRVHAAHEPEMSNTHDPAFKLMTLSWYIQSVNKPNAEHGGTRLKTDQCPRIVSGFYPRQMIYRLADPKQTGKKFYSMVMEFTRILHTGPPFSQRRWVNEG